MEIHSWITEQIFKGLHSVSEYNAIKIETDNKRITKKPPYLKIKQCTLKNPWFKEL